MSIDVTRGYTFSEGEKVTIAKLNSLGNPTAAESAGTITATDVINYFRDADLDKSAFHTQKTGNNTVGGLPISRHWVLTSVGAAVTWEGQNVSDETPEMDDRASFALKITGATGLTSVDLGQFIPQAIAQDLVTRNFTVAFYVYNNTGASVTPQLRTYPATAPDGTDSIGVDVTANMTACADGAWTLCSATIDGTTMNSNGPNGFEIRVRLSNTLDAITEEWWFAQAQLITGTDTNTAPPRQIPNPSIPCLEFQDRKAVNTGGGTSVTTSFGNQRDITHVGDDTNNSPEWGMFGEINGTSDGIKLAPGTYWVRARAPFSAATAVSSRLDLQVQGTTVLRGPNCHAAANASADAIVEGLIHIERWNYELTLVQDISVALATNGLGVPINRTIEEVYTQVFIWRLSDAV